MHDAWADRPWQLTKMLWSVVASALLPATLLSTIDAARRFLEHVRKSDAQQQDVTRKRRRQLDAFRLALCGVG